MIRDPAALVVTVGAVLGALTVIWATIRRAVRGLVDLVSVARDLLQLQPRVVELGERLVELVNEKDDHERRILRLEVAAFTLAPEGTSHAAS